jgi:hypothetical protein
VPVQERDPLSSGRRLRILFFVDRPGVLRQYSTLVAELARRGHEVELALGEVPRDDRLRLVERVASSSERVSWSLAPARAGNGWRSVAWLTRALGDLARYSHPRYARAPSLRRRTTEKILGRLSQPGVVEPLGQRVALRVARRLAATTDARLADRAVAASARLEAAIPTSGAIDRFVREREPDVVLATSLIKLASSQVEFLKSARKLGIPAGICVASWDNLTNKGLLKFVPERVFVWNEPQRVEAAEQHGIPRDRVVATGAQLFDQWFDRRPSRPREELVRLIGLDPDRPYVLFLGSSPFVTNHSDDEVRFVVRWIEALRGADDERLRRIGVAIRPHPVGKEWRGVDLAGFENVSIWPAQLRRPIEPEDQADFFDSLAHSAAVVGINTTAMIEAAIAGKSVLTVLAPEFAQETTLHFHHLLAANGGFVHVASSLPEHASQLGRVLAEGAAGEDLRRRFVESFVRPHGLDRPATPIFADAIEELARLPVERRPDAGALLLRAPLALEAAFTAVMLGSPGAALSGLLRGMRRRVGARARALGLLSPGP